MRLTPGTCGTFLLCLAAAAQLSCASRTRSASLETATQPRSGETLAVLLIDEDKSVGRAIVSNSHGYTELDVGFAFTLAAIGKAPTPVVVMSEAEVERIFGAALSALPPLTQQFEVFFRFESEELTSESRAHLPDILEAVKNHAAREVVVIGHTDTTGASTRNYNLGMSRARAVRDILVSIGLESAIIQVISHGEADQLVPTADEIFEPRNRRVEIMVR
jgi:outer membrane protein OmpA-like peptidoglycan-associated protein